MTRSIVVTGCDLNHHMLAEDLIASLRDVRGATVEIGSSMSAKTRCRLPSPTASTASLTSQMASSVLRNGGDCRWPS